MIAFLGKLREDRVGTTAVEFALVAPILITLMLGVMNFGLYLFFQNSVSTAVDEAARSAIIYPTPSDTEIETNFDEALLTAADYGSAAIAITHGTTTSGKGYIDLVATGTYDINLIFLDLGTIPVRVERRSFVTT